MKKLTTSQALITGFLGASLLAAIAASTYTVTVDSTGVIKYPLNFAAANGLGGGSFGPDGRLNTLYLTNALTVKSGSEIFGNDDWEVTYAPNAIDFYNPGSDNVVIQANTNGIVEMLRLSIAGGALTVDVSGNVGAIGTGSFSSGINQSAPINLSDSIPLNLGTGGSSITAGSSGNTTITSGGDLTIFGGTTFNNGVTFLDTITGSGAGLTGIPSTAITGGFTTNLVIKNGIISTNTLYFTNGILMKVTSP